MQAFLQESLLRQQAVSDVVPDVERLDWNSSLCKHVLLLPLLPESVRSIQHSRLELIIHIRVCLQVFDFFVLTMPLSHYFDLAYILSVTFFNLTMVESFCFFLRLLNLSIENLVDITRI